MKSRRGPQYERPPVHVSKSGTHFVKTADILNSRAGQMAIRRTADTVVSLKDGKLRTKEPSGRRNTNKT